MSALSPSLNTPYLLDMLARWVGHHPQLWIRLGNWESALLRDDIEKISIRSPLYICGLARSGSTLLLEILAAHRKVATHRYRDFPFLFTPCWWNAALEVNPIRRNSGKYERAHGDGMLINTDSPEAMEEMLWMAFFPHLHDALRPCALDGSPPHPEFDRFYHDHLRKMLLVRRAQRYAAKGNYLVTRMSYLQRLFPDARFVIPVRDPASHIVSLMRQHARFTEAGRGNPRITTHMNLAGHFEFGLNRTPIHTGDAGRMQAITGAWSRGEEVRGWALYWDAIYDYIRRRLEEDAALRQAATVVRFDTLCATPGETIRQVLMHSGMEEDDALVSRFAGAIRTPDYYVSSLSDADRALINDITGRTAQFYGITC